MRFKKTHRGFDYATFEDQYGEACSIQKSSLATQDAIWLGIDGPEKKHPVTGEPLGCRMHLSRRDVKKLLPVLERFVATGELTPIRPVPKKPRRKK